MRKLYSASYLPYNFSLFNLFTQIDKINFLSQCRIQISIFYSVFVTIFLFFYHADQIICAPIFPFACKNILFK